MASTYLSKTFSSTTDAQRRTYTISFWIKRSALGTGSGDHDEIVSAYGTTQFGFRFQQNNALDVFDYDGGSNQYVMRRTTNSKFRDVNAWYHIVLAVDTTQSTASDRVKLYINGVQETSFSASNNPSQNHTGTYNKNCLHQIASKAWGNSGNGSDEYRGLMSHFNSVAGTAYDASAFGETDSTTGEWKINTSPSVTYGTNGFFILKDGNSVTDQSGNGNNFTVAGGTLTNTEDCPSNVFATINPLSAYHGDKAILEYGNNQLKSSTGGGAKWYGASTLAFTKGKFYCEVKNITTSNPSLSVGISMNASRNQYENHAVGARNSDIATENYSGNIVINNSNVSVGYGSTWSGSGDICMLAVDADNNKFYIGKNGTWANSDNPSNGTGGYDMSSVANHAESTGFYQFAFGSTSSSYMNSFSVNFGNGYFGTTAVSSAGTNASGNGIFEYDVPTGYTALSTKGLNL